MVTLCTTDAAACTALAFTRIPLSSPYWFSKQCKYLGLVYD